MRLYKYCDAGGIEILRSCAIKVSSPLELNDPFDCKPVPDNWTPASKAALQKQITEKSPMGRALKAGVLPPGVPRGYDLKLLQREWDRVLEDQTSDTNAVRESMENTYKGLAILCLSAQENEPLMWAHYTDKHQGLVLEIETDGVFPLGEEGTKTNRLYKVEYSNERPIFRFDDISSPYTFTTKSSAWAKEEEYRVIYLQSQFTTRVIAGKEMRLRPLPPSCFRAVYLGSQMPESDRDKVKRVLSEEHLKHISLYQMELDARSYLLIPKPA
jgi:hypothetical protein